MPVVKYIFLISWLYIVSIDIIATNHGQTLKDLTLNKSYMTCFRATKYIFTFVELEES